MAASDNFYVSIAGTDLSTYLMSQDVSAGAETNDDTTMGATYRTQESSLRNRAATFTFKQIYASGGPHDTLNAIEGTEVAVITAHDGSTPSTTNPVTTQTMTCVEYLEITPTSVGDLEMCRVSFVSAGAPAVATS